MVAVRFKIFGSAQFLFSMHRALKAVPIQYNPKGRLYYFYQAQQSSNQIGGQVEGSGLVKYNSD
jgi:hypothetical protein